MQIGVESSVSPTVSFSPPHPLLCHSRERFSIPTDSLPDQGQRGVVWRPDVMGRRVTVGFLVSLKNQGRPWMDGQRWSPLWCNSWWPYCWFCGFRLRIVTLISSSFCKLCNNKPVEPIYSTSVAGSHHPIMFLTFWSSQAVAFLKAHVAQLSTGSQCGHS